MEIAIAADHAGYLLKDTIKEYLQSKGHQIKDFGTNSDQSCDYPDYAHPLAKAVNDGAYKLGILICGSANGVNMTANKHQNVRSALCWNVEVAQLARQHNNANVVALPSRFISKELAIEIVEAFVSTDFEGGRHANRVNKIAC
ncbi:MAG: ribose 5-phosphate isomerase B [Bacteroidetes bacterium]|nr:ribose 5-phosphate isomerase B [Bacteroidota bacterium]